MCCHKTLPCYACRLALKVLPCYWQAKKPVVVEEPDDESEEAEDAPVNGAATPATPAKVQGPPLLPPAPVGQPRTSCVLEQA